DAVAAFELSQRVHAAQRQELGVLTSYSLHTHEVGQVDPLQEIGCGDARRFGQLRSTRPRGGAPQQRFCRPDTRLAKTCCLFVGQRTYLIDACHRYAKSPVSKRTGHSTEVARPPRQGYRLGEGGAPPDRLPCPRRVAAVGPSTLPAPTRGGP